MLPITRTSIAALVAMSLAAPASPAFAWGEREQNGLAALLAAGVIGSLIYNSQKSRARPSSRSYFSDQPQYATPRTQYPQTNSYGSNSYGSNSYGSAGYGATPAQTSSIYDTPAAQAFNGYTLSQRQAIQLRMQNWGYYHGSIDGAFGPMTYRSVMAYAGDTQGTDRISTLPGAYQLYDSMIR